MVDLQPIGVNGFHSKWSKRTIWERDGGVELESNSEWCGISCVVVVLRRGYYGYIIMKKYSLLHSSLFACTTSNIFRTFTLFAPL